MKAVRTAAKRHIFQFSQEVGRTVLHNEKRGGCRGYEQGPLPGREITSSKSESILTPSRLRRQGNF